MLLAETEHEPAVEVPPTVGADPRGAEPPRAVVAALDVEHERVAIGVGNLLHGSPGVVAARLVLESQTDSWAVAGLTQTVAEFLNTHPDFARGR